MHLPSLSAALAFLALSPGPALAAYVEINGVAGPAITSLHIVSLVTDDGVRHFHGPIFNGCESMIKYPFVKEFCLGYQSGHVYWTKDPDTKVCFKQTKASSTTCGPCAKGSCQYCYWNKYEETPCV
ncbi:uncharacterized protein B0I36DRAFT_389167 [Microdochium trichocladiopsis]|uniref:Uncharacterized protein n=1 Tax=Microdochium trichocladiopsis TaxID=1682393 RepID=A0A9P8XUT5_9PEZI|nr:uncharacterized protein B0I36DRAFT_389167 [Microdochium trichocladiopsis]KAH7014202.1 hypothetical protein B0I36DRAFT_389167 [Microdochium trichocladiopsis]